MWAESILELFVEILGNLANLFEKDIEPETRWVLGWSDQLLIEASYG